MLALKRTQFPVPTPSHECGARASSHSVPLPSRSIRRKTVSSATPQGPGNGAHLLPLRKAHGARHIC